ncbi:hypothetical protein GGR54DRAFT_591564 [Hypoxylon sp. NC1633]|nr:hypothetical protein GGR54DRAFT_591564 [Hypoxylon sp. NC1633]
MPSARRKTAESQPWLQKIDLPSEGRKKVEDRQMRKAHFDNPETSTTTAGLVSSWPRCQVLQDVWNS